MSQGRGAAADYRKPTETHNRWNSYEQLDTWQIMGETVAEILDNVDRGSRWLPSTIDTYRDLIYTDTVQWCLMKHLWFFDYGLLRLIPGIMYFSNYHNYIEYFFKWFVGIS